mgnify:CR=1 FL=1
MLHELFQIGDLVTRDGTDAHRVTWVNADVGGDLIEVVCVRAPARQWCEVGDVEKNLARRYERLALQEVRP